MASRAEGIIAMRLLILGATGRTGVHLVEQALEQGHEVTVLVRDGARLGAQRARVRLLVGEVTEPAAVMAAAAGQDAVLSVLGSRNPRELLGTDLMRRSIDNVVAAMQAGGVRRVVLLSALGAGASAPGAPVMLRLTFATLLRRIGRDKAASEELLRRSALDWTVVYPPRLTDGPATGHYRHGVDMQVSGIPSVSRGDIAHLMLALLGDESSVRASIMVASATKG
jgi:putative NADH-flavin reductase